MTRLLSFLLFIPLVAGIGRAETSAPNLVLIEGGVFRNTKSNYHGKGVTVASFYLGKYPVTQKEWTRVMAGNPSKFQGDDLPVENVSWYDCVEYCNRRSEQEGLEPFYRIDKTRKDPANENEIDDVKWCVATNAGAKGYRLPTEVEWEYAASGGQLSRDYTYSGSNEIGEVAWYWKNAGDQELSGLWSWPVIEANRNRTKPVGRKKPNELGLHDMSGNVREWCWDWYREIKGPVRPAEGVAPSVRVWRGGGWLGGDFCCEVTFRGGFEASGKGPDQGLRVCRGK